MTAEDVRQVIRSRFPSLFFSAFDITSPPSRKYNCISWAAGQDHDWWWPGGPYWPDGVPKEESLEAFTIAYGNLGYSPCDSAESEADCEKVALYVAPDGRVLHAARQLPSGTWTSKLGDAWDISHELHGLEGSEYGRVARILKRALQSTPPSS